MSSAVISDKAEALADAIRDLNTEVIGFVEGCSQSAWTRKTPEEGWTLPMTGAHIAIGHLVIARWLHRIASGQDITETLADSEVFNASDVRYNSELTQAQVVERLRAYGTALERFVRDLSDQQLTASAMCLGREWTTAGIVEDIAIGHARGHLTNMVAAARIMPTEVL